MIDLDGAYSALGRFVTEQALAADGPIVERYLPLGAGARPAPPPDGGVLAGDECEASIAPAGPHSEYGAEPPPGNARRSRSEP